MSLMAFLFLLLFADGMIERLWGHTVAFFINTNAINKMISPPPSPSPFEGEGEGGGDGEREVVRIQIGLTIQ